MPQQSTHTVLMVEPVSFGFDDQTAQTNTFQNKLAIADSQITHQALAEFDAFVERLRQHEIEVVVFRDQPLPPKPNAVFPNNWLSMWPDGRLFLYPMATESRRIERSHTLLDDLAEAFKVSEIIDFSNEEAAERYLESTGVMVFDHVNKLAYGCISPRCDEDLFQKHAIELGYRPVSFGAYADGTAIYHTNVLMGIQTTTAVVCLEAITHPTERTMVKASLEKTGHEVVDITLDQMSHFCGNVLEVCNKQGDKFLVLSQTAYDAFTEDQRRILGRDKILLPMAIPTIETIGGGSARCMIAEIFLPALSSVAIPSAAAVAAK
jgi:hypothetical protein